MQALLTAKQVAQILSVSAVTVLRLADTGALQAVEVAQRKRKRILRFRPESIETFIAGRERRRGAK